MREDCHVTTDAYSGKAVLRGNKNALKLTFNGQEISLGDDVIFAEPHVDEQEVTSKARVIARLGSAAVAGNVRAEGHPGQANFFLAAAALLPSTKVKRSFGVNMLKADGTPIALGCSEGTIGKILAVVKNLNSENLQQFINHFKDIQHTPQKGVEEVRANLEALGSRIRELTILASDGDSSTVRAQARSDLQDAVITKAVYERLLAHPYVRLISSSTTAGTVGGAPVVGEGRQQAGVVKKGYSKMAIASFLCGIGSIFIVPIPLALVFGYLGVRATGGAGKRGRILAITGIILGLAFIAIYALVAGKQKP